MLAEPIVQPQRLGLPCWTGESIADTIRGTAQVDASHRDRFLACHSPVRHLVDEHTGLSLSESDLFDRLVRSKEQETLVLLRGDPGTGKSHLVNWVKLRFDEARARGQIGDVFPVLIQRRSGSLRDALEQLVSQLPERFAVHLEPIRTAIRRISETEARKRLANAFNLELGVRWLESGKPRLPRQLQELAEAFTSEGFSSWLCRPGGVIDANVQRLVGASEIEDRTSLPEFTAQEFKVGDITCRSPRTNGQKIVFLIEDLDDDDVLADSAAQLCNSVLRGALQELMGLGNTQLENVFEKIRIGLKPQRLVLFIEDVSTLSVLDNEIVNAFEPKNDPELAPLTAVLGMTNPAFSRLPENQRQRANFIFSLGGQSSSWSSSSGELDEFAARYLNAARLDTASIAKIAADRREGADVTVSACDNCRVRDECHQTFGSASFNGTRVGLFPYTNGAVHRLLEKLDVNMESVERTQRGLIKFVLRPVLETIELLASGRSTDFKMAIRRNEPGYWSGFLASYCSGWPLDERNRLAMLAENWVAADTADASARALSPFLKPLSLPDFTTKPAGGQSETQTPQPKRKEPAGGTPSKASTIDKIDARIGQIKERLNRWLSDPTEKLTNPQDAQTLLFNLLKYGLPIGEGRVPPPRLKSLLADRGIVRIEDATTRDARHRFAVDFPRTEETRDLVVALAYHEYQGKGTWDFQPDAEIHKRTVSRWLRRNQERLLAKFAPPQLDTGAPVTEAVRFLALAAQIVAGRELPAEDTAAVAMILDVEAASCRKALGKKLLKLFSDLPERRRLVRNFLIEELDLPQGDGACNMIDPQPIVEALSALRATSLTTVRPLPDGYLDSFWKARYIPLEAFSHWAQLPEALAQEVEELQALVSEIVSRLVILGYDVDDCPGALNLFFKDMTDLVDAQLEDTQPFPDREFDALRGLLKSNSAIWISALRDGIESGNAGDTRLLTFDPDRLLETRRVVDVCVAYVTRLAKFVDDKLAKVTVAGDPDDLFAEFQAKVRKIVALDPSRSEPTVV